MSDAIDENFIVLLDKTLKALMDGKIDRSLLQEWKPLIERVPNILKSLVEERMKERLVEVKYDEKGRIRETKGLAAETGILFASLNDLNLAIKEFSQSSDKYARSMRRLNYTLVVLTIALVVLTLVITLK